MYDPDIRFCVTLLVAFWTDDKSIGKNTTLWIVSLNFFSLPCESAMKFSKADVDKNLERIFNISSAMLFLG